MSIKIGVLNRAANIQANTLNDDKRTVEVTFATDNACQMYNWRTGEIFNEVLGFEEGMIDGTRLDAGAPVLDNHDRYSGTEGVRGVVESWSTEGNKSGKATIRFAKDDDSEKMYQKVKDGILRTLSVGYRVTEYTDITPKAEKDKKGSLRTLRATKWTPMEISFAPVPADPKSTVRKEEEQTWEVPIINERNFQTNNQKNNTMELTPEQQAEKERKDKLAADEQKRLAKEEGIKEERTRSTEITALVNKHRKSFAKPEDADEYLRTALDNHETNVEAVRKYILDLKEEKQPTGGGKNEVTVRGAHKGEAGKADAQVDAILFRMDPDNKAYAESVKDGNEFINLKLMDHVRMYAREHGIQENGSDYDLVKRVFEFSKIRVSTRGGGMATGDFPLIFGNVLDKHLRKEYTFERGKWKPLFYKEDTNLVNTKTTSINMSEFGDLKPVNERGEYKLMTVNEVQEQFMVTKYGGKISISLEMIINDQLGAIDRILRSAARTRTRTEDTIAWAALLGNPIMADGFQLFSADHNNLAAGSAMTVTSVQELITKILTQKGVGGTDDIEDITPHYLVHGPATQLVANNLTSNNFTPAKQTDQVPAYIKSLIPIMTRKITDNAFYVACDPSEIDTIRYGNLTGEKAFSMEEQYGFDNDTYEWKLRLFMGASPTDFRGLAKNPGN